MTHRRIPATIRWAVPALLIAFALALAACSSPVELAEDEAIQPQSVALTSDRESYQIGGEDGVAVRFTFRNARAETAWLSGCGGVMTAVVEREEGGAWTQYAGGHCPASLDMGPVGVEPGAERESGAWIGHPGRYRLRAQYGMQMLGIVYEVVSPAFTVVR